MLPSAKQSAARLASLGWTGRGCAGLLSQALPAESSRQAQTRAAATAVARAAAARLPGRSQHLANRRSGTEQSAFRGYATAAAAAVDWETGRTSNFHNDRLAQEDLESLNQEGLSLFQPSRAQEGWGRDDKSIQSSRSSAHENRVTAAEKFRRIYSSRPVDALLSLTKMSPVEVAEITSHDIRTLLWYLQKTTPNLRHARSMPIAKSTTDDIQSSLFLVRSLLFGLGVGPSDSPQLTNSHGGGLRRRTLGSFLRACIGFRADRLALSTFQERVQESTRLHAVVVDVDPFVRQLALCRCWNYIIDLFSRPNDVVPARLYTPLVVATTMQAFLVHGNPADAVRIFGFHSSFDLVPTSEAYAALIQAHLQQGNTESAREAVKRAESSGVSDIRSQQLAILRGYRTLGFDKKLEDRVFRDLKQLELEPTTAIINALAKLRLDAEDFDGTAKLLGQLDWSEDAPKSAPLKANDESMVIALIVGSLQGDVTVLRSLWSNIVSQGTEITDSMVASLFRCLDRVGAGDEVLETISSLVLRTPTKKWPMPRQFRPEVRSFNAALAPACRARGYDGLVQLTRLMRQANVNADSTTLENALRFASEQYESTPHAIALLLTELLDRSSVIRPTPRQVDLIVAKAVSEAARKRSRETSVENGRAGLAKLPVTSSSGTTSLAHMSAREVRPDIDFTGGISLSLGPVHNALHRIMQSLRSTGQAPTATALSHRLWLEAMTPPSSNAGLRARDAWSALVSRGYRPEAKHIGVLMRGFAMAGSMREAEDVLNLARDSGIEPTVQMLTILAMGYGTIGDGRGVLRVYNSLRKQGQMDIVSICAVVRALSESGQRAKAVEVADRELAAFPKLDQRAVLTVAHALRRADNIRGAFNLIDTHCRVSKSELLSSSTSSSTETSSSSSADSSSPPSSHLPPVKWALGGYLRRLVRNALNYLLKDEESMLAQFPSLRYSATSISDGRVATHSAQPGTPGSDRAVVKDSALAVDWANLQAMIKLGRDMLDSDERYRAMNGKKALVRGQIVRKETLRPAVRRQIMRKVVPLPRSEEKKV